MASLENSRDQGLEVMRVGGKVYARNRYGTFRQRLRDRGMAERTRAELTGAIRDFDALFQGRMKLAPQGTVTHEGRTAWRYSVKLAPGGPRARPDGRCPPCSTPKRRPRRDDPPPPGLLRAPRAQVAQRARCWWTPATSVVLKARLDGRLSVPADKTPGAPPSCA